MALLLTACGGGESADDKIEVAADAGVGVELESTKWQTDDVDRDATLVAATTQMLVSSDPHATGIQVSTIYFNLIYDRLFWVTADSQLRGYLVKDWEFNDDGLELVLRDDATFHDGSKIDAAAVKANIDRERTAETSAWVSTLSIIEDVEVVDEFRLQLHTKAKTGATLPYVFGGWAGMMMNPKFFNDPEALKTTAPDGIGSGPYKITSWTPGEDVVHLERVEGHWDKSAGQAAKVEFRRTPDQNRVLDAVAAGDYDVARFSSEAAVDALDAVRKAPDNLHAGDPIPSNSITALWMRDNVEPSIREAIALTIDSEALLAQYRGGAAATNQFFGEGHPGHNPAIDALMVRDVEKARDLVKQASAASTKITMAYPETGLESRLAQLIQAQLKEVGIEITLKPLAYAALYPEWYQNKFEMVLMGNAGVAHASTLIDSSLLRGGISWGAPDAALESITAELATADDPALDDAARNKIYQDIFLQAAEERWVVPFARLNFVSVGASKVVNIAPAFPQQYQGMEDFRYVGVSAD